MVVSDNSQLNGSTQTLSDPKEAPKGKGKLSPVEGADSTIEAQLASAKANRTRAETARQRVVNEIMEATKELYQRLVSEGELSLEKAKQLDAESELKLLEAQRELEQAQSIKAEADTYREKIILQTQQQAQEILDEAQAIKADAVAFQESLLTQVQQQAQEEFDRAQAIRIEAEAYREEVLAETQQQASEILHQAHLAAEQEGAEIKQKYAIDAEKALAQAELIKDAAQEQLETQKLYTEAVTLETESHEVLKRARAKLGHRGSNQRGSSSSSQEPVGIARLLKPGQGDAKTENSLVKEESSSKKQLSKNELVVGLELDGYAKAYPIQLVSSRKIINDTVAGEDVAVIFGPPSEVGIIFKRCLDGRLLTFAPLPGGDNGLTLMKDEETGTTWETLTGRAISGALVQKELQRLVSEYSFWFAWSSLHPDTEIYAGD